MKIDIAGVDSVLITFANSVSKKCFVTITNYTSSLKAKNIKGIKSIIPSYTTILITYDIRVFSFIKIQNILMSIDFNNSEITNTNIIDIKVFYDERVGFDLPRLSKLHGLDIEEIINIHSSVIYDVYAIGFLPGFTYLGEVDKRICTKRLDSPRKNVPKGSVAIADNQSAIYPQNSPGGWNIIGRTTLELFDKNLEQLCPVKVGDKIRFIPICEEEYLNLGGEI